MTPSTPVAGADVALRVQGCSGKTATAVSEAFVADARLAGTGGTLAGETKVRSTVRPGSYDVKITCADFEIKGAITVVEQSASAGVSASPVAPVHAGGGGTAHFASVDAHPAAPNTAHAVTGLVLAGVAAAAVAVLSGRRRRGSE